MKRTLIRVTLKKSKKEKAEIELPAYLFSFISLFIKNQNGDSQEDLKLIEIPFWLYQISELLVFLFKIFKNIKLIIWIIIFITSAVIILIGI